MGRQPAKQTPESQYWADLLKKAPYDLAHLSQENGDLETVTGKDLVGMFLCAKQRGRVSGLKDLWSRRRVTNVEPEDDYIRRVGSIDCTKIAPRIADASTSSPPKSPVTDRSPSPPPHAVRRRIFDEQVKYQYYRLSYAGRDVPILVVSCYDGKTTQRKMCCYGGAKEIQDGNKKYLERNFLSSWEYTPYICID